MAAAVMAIRAKKRRLAAAEVEQTFQSFDKDRSGAIDRSELSAALLKLGLVSDDKAELGPLLSKYGIGEGATTLNEEQFKQLVERMAHDRMSPFHRAVDSCFKRMPLWRYHETALGIYSNWWVQLLVALMIISNFLVNIIEKEIDPYPPQMQLYGPYWDNFDTVFNLLFTVELLLNVWSCGGPYKKFWKSGWNVFDFIIVAVGIILMMGITGPNNPLSQLKMLRAFRVFRLFKRVKSLNKVIMALLKAIPGVSNAFIIMIIFMMIYAILAVEYFAPFGTEFGEPSDGNYITFGVDRNGVTFNHSIPADTLRGYQYGYEYYGTFTRALFTLFQVMTGESWAEVVVRPLLFGLYRNAIFVAVFFVSFILLTQIVLTNVVVAVLLDKFVEDPGEEPAADAEATPPASPQASGSGGLATPMPLPSSGSKGVIASGVDVSEFRKADADEKLTLLLVELHSLKAAVQRCESGMADLKLAA